MNLLINDNRDKYFPDSSILDPSSQIISQITLQEKGKHNLHICFLVESEKICILNRSSYLQLFTGMYKSKITLSIFSILTLSLSDGEIAEDHVSQPIQYQSTHATVILCACW